LEQCPLLFFVTKVISPLRVALTAAITPYVHNKLQQFKSAKKEDQ